MVIVVLTYYLPQHQHPAPGVLEVRSLALLDHSRADQQILLDERSTDSWQLYQDQPLLQAGLRPQQHSQSHLLHCRGAPRKALLRVCPSARASDGLSAKAPGCSWMCLRAKD